MAFDPKKVTKDCIDWIKDFFDRNGKDCQAIVGISGGKDSTIVAKLCVEALGADRVVGVLMPNYSIDECDRATRETHNLFIQDCSNPDYDFERLDKFKSATSSVIDGLKVCRLLGIRSYVVNIHDPYQNILKTIGNFSELTEQTKINLAPRLRMSTLYAISQSMNGRVAMTGNYSEIFLGYSTRWGDSAGDFAPLASLTVTEVKQIGYELGLPKFLIERTPDDGLSGKTDEENFGFTYSELDNYIRHGNATEEIKQLIAERHNKNSFKVKPIPQFNFKGN